MKFGCLVLCVIAAAQAASIQKRNSIPVKVVYDHSFGVRNLDGKVQIPQEIAKIEEIVEEQQKIEEKPLVRNGVKNLEEKIQLSPEERGVATKHFPGILNDGVDDSQDEKRAIVKRTEEIIYQGLEAIRENVEKFPQKPSEEAWAKLNQTIEKLLNDEKRVLDIKQEGPSNQNQFVQNVLAGLQNTVNNFIQGGQGNKVNGTEDEQSGQQGFGQNVINAISGGFSQIFSNVNNANGQGTTSNTVLGDTGVSTTQQPNIFNNFINQVQGFLGGSNPGNPSQSISLNQSDTGVQPATNPPNFIQGAINQVSNVVNNFRPPSPANPPQGSEDPGTGTTQGTNIFGSIGQFFGNLNRPTETPSGSNPVVVGAQVIGGQIQQGVQGVLAGSGTTVAAVEATTKGEIKPVTENVKEKRKKEEETTGKPATSQDEVSTSKVQEVSSTTVASTTKPNNFFASIGQAWQNVNPFKPSTTKKPVVAEAAPPAKEPAKEAVKEKKEREEIMETTE